MKLEWYEKEMKDLKLKNSNLEKTKEMHDITISTVGRFWERVCYFRHTSRLDGMSFPRDLL